MRLKKKKKNLKKLLFLRTPSTSLLLLCQAGCYPELYPHQTKSFLIQYVCQEGCSHPFGFLLKKQSAAGLSHTDWFIHIFRAFRMKRSYKIILSDLL